MKILLVDRNMQELIGIRWYLQTYLAGDLAFEFSTTATDTITKMHTFCPDILLINIDLLPDRAHTTIYTLLQQTNCHVFAMTSDSLYQNALKAIDIHAKALWTKPIDLEQFMRKITQQKSGRLHLGAVSNKQSRDDTARDNSDAFYLQLFWGEHKTDKVFTLIEPAETSSLVVLYDWLQDSIAFLHVDVYPFSNWLVCLFPENTVEKDIRMVQKQWQQEQQVLLNISIYDGEESPLKDCYVSTKKALEQCFYVGFGHVFYTTKTVTPVSFDPLLSPEQQQEVITSLEQLDIEQFKQFLLPLQKQYFEQEDVRVHLTSVLAQVRRFMLSYQLGLYEQLESAYRKLFRLIIEHPILFTIINEIIRFTELLIETVKSLRVQEKRSYPSLAKELIRNRLHEADLSLKVIASTLGISSDYLSSLFAKEEGIHLKKYMQRVRIERACELLKDDTRPIHEIATSCGFDDPNYFSKTFKGWKGITPRQFRGE